MKSGLLLSSGYNYEMHRLISHSLKLLILIVLVNFLVFPLGSTSTTTHNSTGTQSTNVSTIMSVSFLSSTSMFEFTSTIEPSFSSMDFTSSSIFPTTSTASSTPTLPPPVREIIVRHENCFYLEASDINFVFFDNKFENISAYMLAHKYAVNDTIFGCTTDSKIHTFTRQYNNINTNRTVMSFSLEFTHENVYDSWHLSNLNVMNVTNDDVHFFVYGDCGDAVNVPDGLSYFCGQIDCYGHEQVNETMTVKIDITNLRVDAFIKSGYLPSSDVTVCGASSPSNKGAFLVVALVIGATLTLTVLIIIASFVYKRCKYGRYNLLD